MSRRQETAVVVVQKIKLTALAQAVRVQRKAPSRAGPTSSGAAQLAAHAVAPTAAPRLSSSCARVQSAPSSCTANLDSVSNKDCCCLPTVLIGKLTRVACRLQRAALNAHRTVPPVPESSHPSLLLFPLFTCPFSSFAGELLKKELSHSLANDATTRNLIDDAAVSAKCGGRAENVHRWSIDEIDAPAYASAQTSKPQHTFSNQIEQTAVSCST